MFVRALKAALQRWFGPRQGPFPELTPPPSPSEPKPKPPPIRYSDLVSLIAAEDTALTPNQVRQVCDCVLQQFAVLIEQNQAFISPVLSFQVITRPDQTRFARVVRRVPSAR